MRYFKYQINLLMLLNSQDAWIYPSLELYPITSAPHPTLPVSDRKKRSNTRLVLLGRALKLMDRPAVI